MYTDKTYFILNIFFNLQLRTRSSLLSSLVDDLRRKSNEFLGIAEVQEPPKLETPGTRFTEIVRKVLRGRPPNQDPAGLVKKTTATNNSNNLAGGTPSVRFCCYCLLSRMLGFLRDLILIYLLLMYMLLLFLFL